MSGSTQTAPVPVAAWRERVAAAGDGNPLDARFVCPLCGNVASPRQFTAAGVQPERAFQNCIGRFTGAKGNLSSPQPVPQPCDWAAYGLFGTLNAGTQIELEDGSICWVFDLAEPEGGAS